MISRIWHGYTAPADADSYEQLLSTEIFTGIIDRRIPASGRSNCSGAT